MLHLPKILALTLLISADRLLVSAAADGDVSKHAHLAFFSASGCGPAQKAPDTSASVAIQKTGAKDFCGTLKSYEAGQYDFMGINWGSGSSNSNPDNGMEAKQVTLYTDTACEHVAKWYVQGGQKGDGSDIDGNISCFNTSDYGGPFLSVMMHKDGDADNPSKTAVGAPAVDTAISR